MKTVFLDFDDFSEDNNRLDYLWMLKNEYSNFKVNLFAIPEKCGGKFLDYIHNLSWIQLCIHGWFHKNNEEVGPEHLEICTRDLGFAKIYRAPHWQLSETMYKRLKEMGFKIMLHPDDSREGIKYNWNIKDSPPNFDRIYAHGHIQDVCGNGIVESFGNLMKLPKDTEFSFL